MAAGLVMAVFGARFPRRTARPPPVAQGSAMVRMMPVLWILASATFSATGFAADRQGVPVEKGQDLLHDRRHAAGGMKIRDIRRRGRVHLGNVRRGAAQFFEVIHVEIDVRLVGDGQHVQDGIGRPADGGVEADGVFDALSVDDLPGRDALP